MAVGNRRRTFSSAIVTFLGLYATMLLRLLVEDQQVKEVKVADSQFILDSKVSPEDPRLIKHIYGLIRPPSTAAYNLTKKPNMWRGLKGGDGQAALIDRLLLRKSNGFFIEAGAFDGEYLSNSLFFELRRNWTGLLVEPNSRAFRNLLTKGRKAFAINTCLSVHNYPEEVEFDSADVYGAIVSSENNNNGSLDRLRETLAEGERFKERKTCFPLYSLLLAIGNPTIDFLSLDVEGSELAVLKTIPFDKVDIRTLTVEVVHSDAKAIVKFLAMQGFKVYRRLQTDIVFVHRT